MQISFIKKNTLTHAARRKCKQKQITKRKHLQSLPVRISADTYTILRNWNNKQPFWKMPTMIYLRTNKDKPLLFYRKLKRKNKSNGIPKTIWNVLYTIFAEFFWNISIIIYSKILFWFQGHFSGFFNLQQKCCFSIDCVYNSIRYILTNSVPLLWPFAYHRNPFLWEILYKYTLKNTTNLFLF